MTNALHRVGDANDAGGVVTSTPHQTVLANGQLVAVDGSRGTAHTPFRTPHLDAQWTTANGNPTVLVEGFPVNRTGDADTCGHTRATGSPNVFVG